MLNTLCKYVTVMSLTNAEIIALQYTLVTEKLQAGRTECHAGVSKLLSPTRLFLILSPSLSTLTTSINRFHCAENRQSGPGDYIYWVVLLNRGYMCNLLHAICCRGAKITVQLFQTWLYVQFIACNKLHAIIASICMQ